MYIDVYIYTHPPLKGAGVSSKEHSTYLQKYDATCVVTARYLRKLAMIYSGK